MDSLSMLELLKDIGHFEKCNIPLLFNPMSESPTGESFAVT
jgi:hypothetical protein